MNDRLYVFRARNWTIRNCTQQKLHTAMQDDLEHNISNTILKS